MCHAVLALASLVLWFALQPSSARASFAGLSLEEWTRLNAGAQIVRRRTAELHGVELFGGDVWRRIDAPASQIWNIAVEPAFYRRLLPHAVEARRAPHCVRIVHAVGLSEVSYCVRVRRDDARQILRFDVQPERDGSVRRGWAELRLRPVSPTASVVYWTVMAAPELGFFGELFRDAVQDAMLEVPERLERLVTEVDRSNRARAASRRDLS